MGEVYRAQDTTLGRDVAITVLPESAGITIANYDVTRDGQRFVMVKDDTALGLLRVVLNWHASAPAAARVN